METKKKKSTLSAEGLRKIVEAQKRRHAASRDLPAPVIPKVADVCFDAAKDGTEFPRGTGQTIQGPSPVELLRGRIAALEEELGDMTNEREDLVTTVTNELRYHQLRVIELNRELERRGITIG